MSKLFAQPYNADYIGFYFDSFDEYEQGMETLNEQGCEEVEIQFIDGDNPSLFKAAGIDQSNIETWFEDLNEIDDVDTKALQIRFLLDVGKDLDDAIKQHDEVNIFEGSKDDYAYEFVRDCYDLTEITQLGSLIHYIDYDAIGSDMELEGSICEIDSDKWVTNALDF